MPDASRTTERLAAAMQVAHCPPAMVQRARDGWYDDFRSPLVAPCIELVADLERIGQRKLAQRARNGEFDATRDEAEAWRRSEEGQAAFRDLSGGHR
jgi:hypothetical protein